MKLQNRLFLSVILMGAAATAIGLICLQSSRALFDNQAKVYDSGLAVFHLKKVSDAYGVAVIGAVEKVRNGAAWAWEDGGKAIDEAEKSADEHWKAYMAMDKTKDEKYQASIVGALLDNNKHLMENLKNDFANKDARDLEIQATSVLYPSIDPVLDNIRKLEDLNEKAGQEAVDQAEKGFTGSFNFMGGAVAVLLFLGLVGGFWTASWALKPVGASALGWEADVRQVAELGGQVSSSASQLVSSLSAAAGQLQKTAGASEQAVSMIQQKSQETARARGFLDEAQSALALSGDSAQRAVDQARAMGQSAEKVFQVVKTIEEIAFQTNILALNAGVEAVRAGEQGKEFVLVVEEIRNLSQRCAQVAKETSKLVNENTRQTSEGMRLSEDTAKAVQQAKEKAGKVEGLLSVMEEGADNQLRGFQEIHSAIGNAEREAFRNMSLAEKAAASGAALAQKAESLQALSRQLADWVKGPAKGAVKPRVKGTIPAASPSSVSRVPDKAGDMDFRLPEKTGTDDGKVIPIK